MKKNTYSQLLDAVQRRSQSAQKATSVQSKLSGLYTTQQDSYTFDSQRWNQVKPQPPQSLQDVDRYPPGWESAVVNTHSIFSANPPPNWGLREVPGGRLEVGDYIQAARYSAQINVWAVYVGRTKAGTLGHASHGDGGNTAAFREDHRLADPGYRFLVRRRGPQFNEWGEDSL